MSGVGVVAYGVVFADGHVALRWASTHPATSLWSSLDDLVAVHGHGEATSIEWLDPATDPFAQPLASRGAGRRARRVQPTPVIPEPVVEPDVTRETRPIQLEPEPEPEPEAEPTAARPEPEHARPKPARPEPARPEPTAVRPQPGRPDALRTELLGPDMPHPEPLRPRARPEPVLPADPPAQPDQPVPPVRPAQPAQPEPPAQPGPPAQREPATPPDATPPPPPPAESVNANGGRPGHLRLPAQRGAGRHRRSTPPTQSRATYQIESDGS
ncbi:hypothetical protein SAMN04488563_1741 [Jiangella alkaliphila]|uniref:Uncharacterized protein n=1 Tax=Jiangella alkaliphila TaxID=419479 RepID=A0A1H2IIP1_9ACTN|nr:hypothetical protein SAMN04488563_1741 [Jiangella alkaliphila]